MALTDEQVADLRTRVTASQRRRSPGRRIGVHFQGGPLDGMKVAVEENAAKGLYIAWCYVTDTGPVQALYRSEELGLWRWEAYDLGTR